jgi:NAD(P)-dependent dehydrogenase (short-subunit alcohol dehydrogenase family)
MGTKLKILVVGGAGTLGKAICNELGERHEVIVAGRATGDVQLDITQTASIKSGLAKIGKVNAVVCAAGEVAFRPLAEIEAKQLDDSSYALGIKNKLLGQVNLTLAAREYLLDGGSITLTTGILSEHPILSGSSASMVNGAIEAFVRAAAIELPRGLRINAVSPNVFIESMGKYAPFFRGFEPIPVARAAIAFSRSVEGPQTGQIYKVF